MDTVCCKDMVDAMYGLPNSFFLMEDNGNIYLTVGYVQTADGTGWFDQAVIFCPFCGKQLQDRDEIRKRSSQT